MKQQYTGFRKRQLTRPQKMGEEADAHNFRSWNQDGQAVTNLADPRKMSLKIKISIAANDPVHTLKSPKRLKT